jgi:hypothetical protein
MVTRIGIDEDTLEALSGVFHPVVFVSLDWPDDPVRVHSGNGVLEWDDIEWGGVRAAGGLTLPGDAEGVQIDRGSVTLGGDQERIYDLLANAKAAQGQDAAAWFGAVTEREGTTLVGPPFMAWQGYMGEAREVQTFDGVNTRFEIQVALDSQPAPRARGTAIHNEADQRARDPDTVFPDTSGRHLRGMGQRVRNVLSRE